ncbi:TadE/TadG family type IV pilus assembly protein [Nocardioides coralli]|uniref:TadE/TadG family type IV pilus assembly protein n=1 Tax=Nocardioides coralli TaxID=2872154 RepID=UPI0020171170|nr:TadE/TadG family type IV pilus assembly protein [Nocardioides coralli]
MADFVLVLVVLIPLFLGVLQVGLVLFVRNTLANAAAEGARHAAAFDRDLADGERRTREQVGAAVSGRFARHVDVRTVSLGGQLTVEVVVHASVPALGIGGPAIGLDVVGHAVEEAP